jgi:hypothetical protein
MKTFVRVVTISLVVAGFAACSAGQADDREQGSATEASPHAGEPQQEAELASRDVAESAELGRLEQAIGNCCQYGAYICPSTGIDYEYAPPGCGFMTKPQARTACDNACTPACTDTGFYDVC